MKRSKHCRQARPLGSKLGPPPASLQPVSPGSSHSITGQGFRWVLRLPLPTCQPQPLLSGPRKTHPVDKRAWGALGGTLARWGCSLGLAGPCPEPGAAACLSPTYLCSLPETGAMSRPRLPRWGLGRSKCKDGINGAWVQKTTQGPRPLTQPQGKGRFSVFSGQGRSLGRLLS